MTEKLQLYMIPAKTDPLESSKEYQDSLQQVADALTRNAMQPSFICDLQESAGAPTESVVLGFTIELAKALGPLATIVAAWLAGRYGRKVRLKIGEIEAEAGTVEEVERLIARAHKVHSRK